MGEKCDACNGRLEEDFISDYASMAVDQRPCGKCRGNGVLRTGPYRLADGTWSDGVDRSQPLVMSGFGSANEDRMTVFWMRHGSKFGVAAGNPETFPEFESFAEAIAYADRMARTNQGENND